MSFSSKLAEHAAATEAWLTAWLSANTAAADVPERLASAIAYGALGGGKRFRPALVIESAALFDVGRDKALPAAAALEAIHCYSLIHDDLPAMDDDDLRRGRPTVHRAYDEATAILAGDSLLTLAFEILADPASGYAPDIAAILAFRLARAAGAGGMAGGQMLDLSAEGQTLGLLDIARLQGKKTGALITFACEAGAVLGRASEADRASLIRFGEILGLAFQISDDLLDVAGDATQVGKAVGKDAAAGKATYVSVLGIEGARARLEALGDEADATLRPFGERAAALRAAYQFVTERQH